MKLRTLSSVASFAVAVCVAAGGMAQAAEYYAGDQARTEKRGVSSEAAGLMSSSGDSASTASGAGSVSGATAGHVFLPPGHLGPLSSQAAGAAPVPIAMTDPADLYDPAVERALADSGLDRLAVQAEGVNQSLRTFAEVQAQAITGQSRFKLADGRRIDPLYLVLGMIYQGKAWATAPIIPIEDRNLAERLGLDSRQHNHVSPVWIMRTPVANTLVLGEIMGDGSASAQLPKSEKDALKKLASRVGAFLNLSGEYRLVPVVGDERGRWVAPAQLLRPELLDKDPDLQTAVAQLDQRREPYVSGLELDGALRQAFDRRDASSLKSAVAGYLKQVDGTPDYMLGWVRRLDYWNTIVHPYQKASLLSMAAFFAFIFYFTTARRRRDSQQSGGAGGRGAKGNAAGKASSALAAGTGATVAAFAASLSGSMEPAMAASIGATSSDIGFSPVSEGRPVLIPPAKPVAGGSGRSAGASGSADDAERSAADAAAGIVRHGTTGDVALDASREAAEGSRGAWAVAYTLLVLAAMMMITALVMRGVIKGWSMPTTDMRGWSMPVSNMYESITFAMTAFAVLGVVFEGISRRGWIGIGVSLAGWALMTLANSLPVHMRKLEPLVAVLNSIWLNFHVTSLLLSYSAFLLAFVLGIFYLIKDATGNRVDGVLPRKELFEYYAYRAIQVGWPLLTLGILLGAVWANTAWGSYWSWDPKETWALITWFCYTIFLHLRMNLGWRARRAVLTNMLGFVLVLLTYFGVSYLPGLSGGMHSYAEPISRQ